MDIRSSLKSHPAKWCAILLACAIIILVAARLFGVPNSEDQIIALAARWELEYTSRGARLVPSSVDAVARYCTDRSANDLRAILVLLPKLEGRKIGSLKFASANDKYFRIRLSDEIAIQAITRKDESLMHQWLMTSPKSALMSLPLEFVLVTQWNPSDPYEGLRLLNDVARIPYSASTAHFKSICDLCLFRAFAGLISSFPNRFERLSDSNIDDIRNWFSQCKSARINESYPIRVSEWDLLARPTFALFECR